MMVVLMGKVYARKVDESFCLLAICYIAYNTRFCMAHYVYGVAASNFLFLTRHFANTSD